MERFVINDRSTIVVGRDVLVGGLLPESERTKVLFVAQPSVADRARRIAETLDVESAVEVVPDGDAAKTLEVAKSLYEAANKLGLTRHDTIVGVGGGAVTDLAGFVAATYLRGVEAVLVPTTTLGAVDAAIGGKTAVNVGGKNLVGAFHLPSRVIVDLDVLDALPAHTRREGLAEALKAGLIADERLLATLEADGIDASLDYVIPAAIAVKVDVVADDLTEHGRRAILNYGHTLGHAIEVAGGVSHGDAVAIGMVAAGRVSAVVHGFDAEERQKGVIAKLGLPVSAPRCDPAEIRRLVYLDKKRDASGVRMVLLKAVADPVVESVADGALHQGLGAVGVEYPLA
ncbi:MAG: 3-dehydroquinate synthase [Acidimicrobiia bacterium]|nr:3-dehydroquinate synthase [Acidimicrobiia bacterium]